MKYAPLRDYLSSRNTTEVPMTFEEIERTIGQRLPAKASNHRAWWSNNPSNSVMTKAWLEAGYKSEQVDMASRKLVFRKAETSRPSQRAAVKTGNFKAVYGALRGTMSFHDDITAPTGARWSAAED